MNLMLVAVTVALVLLFGNPAEIKAQTPKGGECDTQKEDLADGCKPCPQDKWQNMVSSKSSGLPAVPPIMVSPKCQDLIYFTMNDSCEVTDGADCFNTDPLSGSSTGEAAVISVSDPVLDQQLSSLGFSIPEIPFFRYFLPPDARAAKNYKKFDIGQVSEYYVSDATSSKGGQTFDTDFELFEWPGKTGIQNSLFLEDVTIPAYGCVDDSYAPSSRTCLQKHGFVMLAFDRDKAKFLNYPCNSIRGSYVVAYGNIRALPPENVGELRNPKGEPFQKVWLSNGINSIHKDYVQPLFVRTATLNSMISNESPGKCDEISDLRTVMDFSFSTNRLILGMKCGIIIIDGILSSSFIASAAKLKKPGGQTNAFGTSINKIAGSVCCGGELQCGGSRTIVAAYSFDAARQPDDLKYLFVSFDRGHTFEIKFVAPASSLINLIKSLYGMYERWDQFYKFIDENSDDEMFGDLRKFKLWKYLNAEEKQAFISKHASGLGAGVALEGFQKIHNIFCAKVKQQFEKLGPEYSGDVTPKWVQASIDARYKEFGLDNKTECDKNTTCKENFQEDLVVKEIMKDYFKDYDCSYRMSEWKKKTVVETRKPKPNEMYCLEITSLVVVELEQNLLVLCKVGFCSATGSGPPDCSTVPVDTNLYALFEINIQPAVPIAFPVRRSKRIFECKLMKYATMTGHETQEIQPEIAQVPGSSSIFILNCENVLYFSGNAGRTIFNTAFYFLDETDPAMKKFTRNYVLDDLDVPPLIAMDNRGQSVVLTFRNSYAYGIINYNRENRLLVGKTFEKPKGGGTAVSNLNEAEVVAIPWFSNSGEVTVSLAILGIIGREPEYKDFYQHRHAIKLVPIPLSFYKDIIPFYEENLNVNEQARAKKQNYKDCATFSFAFRPTSARLDVGDSVVIQIDVTDVNRLLPLGIFSNQEKSLLVDVEFSNRSQKDVLQHDWDVTITALPYFKDKDEALINGFFGADYNNLYEYSTNVVLINLPNIRCHVQPSGVVSTEIGCLGKTLVAHEEEYRPQCKNKFIKNQKYTIQPGMYDPELARYWIENNPSFIARDTETGELSITYDYSTFGCPLEPYNGDKFSPDLKILSEVNRRNTSLGRTYNGSYVLIEIFGAKGYEYLFKVKDVGCNRPPQTKKSMVRDWIIRRRIFNISKARLNVFARDKEGGSILFDGDFVDQHLNIWNRVNYEPCISDDQTGPPLSDSENEASYEIMNNGLEINCEDCKVNSPNKLIWASSNRPRVFIFLAVAVDSSGTHCNHFTFFGVSLPNAYEVEDLVSFIVFSVFVFLWIFLVLMGYWCRKSYLRKAYIHEARSERLKQAAWTVIYRYEKLLHENENKEMETEITDFARELHQKDREEGYQHMQHQAHQVDQLNSEIKVGKKSTSKPIKPAN